jgi:phage FluMu gp28-like protein
MSREEPEYRFVQKLPLHPKQEIVWDVYFSGKYRAFVINAGRRFGKSTVGKAIGIEEAVNYGKKVWWVGKTYKDAGNQWRELKQIMRGIYTSKNEVERRMEFYYTLPSGTEMRGEIVFRSADKPDNLRGDGIDVLIVDEAAFQSPEVWKVLRPALVDTKGNVIFISTPNGHNWFYSFFERGKEENKSQYPRWWSREFTSYDNSFLDPKEIDDAKADMTDTEFRIEHMAEFIDDIGKVFTGVRPVCTGMQYDIPRQYGHFSIGVDLARKHDATVVCIFDTEKNKQARIYRFIGLDWALQKAKIKGIIEAWIPETIFVDATAVGQPVVEDLQKMIPDFLITPFVLSAQSKPVLIQNLSVRIQNKEIILLDENQDNGRIQLNELLAYEVRKTKNEMRYTYSAPIGGKDDTVIALALAIQGMTGRKRDIVITDNPIFPDPHKQPLEKLSRMSEYARKSYELKKALLEKVKL